METVPSACVLKTGRPDISLILKIVPLDKLLLIENNCPALPSNESELSERTDNVIGWFAKPTKFNEYVEAPVPPNVPLENNKFPFTVVVPPIVAAPETTKF
jgi:hypothetical protein